MREVKILYNLKESIKKIKKKLFGFERISGDIITDIYYKMPTKTCLRLRQDNLGVHFTYKKDIYKDNKWFYSKEEVETKSFEKTKKLLGNLFEEWLKITMGRIIYENEKYKIVIDSIENVGDFLEVKSKKDVEDIEKAKQDIRTFIVKTGININEIINNKGKPEIVATFLKQNEKNNSS